MALAPRCGRIGDGAGRVSTDRVREKPKTGGAEEAVGGAAADTLRTAARHLVVNLGRLRPNRRRARSPCSNIWGPWVEGLWSLGRSSVCRRATSAQASCLTNVRALSGTPALWRSFFGPGPPPSLGSFAVLPSRLPKFGPGARACVVGRCIRSLHCNSQMQPALLGNSTRTHNGAIHSLEPRVAARLSFFLFRRLSVHIHPLREAST